MRAALDAGEGFVREVVNVHKAGTPYWVRVSVQPLRTPRGAIVGFAGVQRDVTARRLRQELDALEASLADALVGAESEGAALAVAADRFAAISLVGRVTVFRSGRSGLDVVALRASPDPTRAGRIPPSPEPPTALPAPGTLTESPPTAEHCRRIALSLPLGVGALLCLDVVEHMPGREALVARLPEMGFRLAQFVQRRAEQERFEVLFERSPTLLLLLDRSGRVDRFNALAARMWPALTRGASAHEVLGAPKALLDRAVALEVGARLEGAWAFRGPHHEEASDGAFIEGTFAVMPAEQEAGVLVAARDATARHQAELALGRTLAAQSRTLAEREVLLREVHHRVKNNLQIVSSLLAMQADCTGSAEARLDLERSGARVRSMALVHQLLYGGTNLAFIDLAEYVRLLSTELRNAMDPRAELALDLHEAHVTIETAVPCALVVNELVTNALKHGRSADGVCRVRLGVAQTEQATVVRVEDEGQGLSGNPRTTGSIGMTIVAALVRQLGARLEAGEGGGGRWALTIPRTQGTAT